MATSANLMGSEVHDVQEVWTSQKDYKAAHHMTKTSPKDIHFFRVMPPMEFPKIMGLRVIHSPEALWWWGGLSFCLWCRKGQNEGTVENHLQTSHYHLGLISRHCVEYYTMSATAMHQHSQPCKPVPASIDDNNDQENESDNNDNGGEYHDELAFYKD